LKKLNKLLIDPIDAMLPKDKDAVVTFIPHEFLFNVPFAALIGSDGNYLVEKHTLAYAPALGVLRATQRLAHESSANGKKLLAFGNPITKEIAFLGALPYAEKEVQKIAEIFGLDNAIVRTGGTANKVEFTKLAPSASAIHLATHGL
jgi:CHAT domain-containing protein